MSYLIATSIHHCNEHLSASVDYSKLPDATILAVLKDGNYLLSKIVPSIKETTCYISTSGDTMKVDVRDVFSMIQGNSCIAWCEL